MGDVQFTPVALEPAAEALAKAAGEPPFIWEISVAQGRLSLDDAQAGEVAAPTVQEEWLTVSGGPAGELPVRVVRSDEANGRLPVILFLHGGGWVFGNARTHDRLVRELCAGTGAAVVSPEYHLSPEARFSVAVEEAYLTAQWITREAADHRLDAGRLAIAGDSVGGNLAIAQTLLARRRKDVGFVAQALFYPVTDAAFDTGSYRQFAEHHGLQREAMRWFWDQYTTDPDERTQFIASPLRAPTEELRGLPKALVITAEADVLRDEGEAYGRHLRSAGVDVTALRCEGVIHDFMMLNALRETNGARVAIAQAISFLAAALEAKT